MDSGRSVDKHSACDFPHNIIIHSTLSICGRMAGLETWDPKRGLKLSCLVSSRMVLIRQVSLDSLHDAGLSGRWAYRVVGLGLKAMVLIMPPIFFD